MKRSFTAAAAAGAAAIMLLSGFDSTMTLQELQEKTKSALSQAESVSVTVNAVADAELSVQQNVENGASMNVPLNAASDITLNLNMEPLQLQMDLNYSYEAMGQGMGGMFSTYLMENEDGTATVYSMNSINEGAQQWMQEEVDAQSLSQVKQTLRSAFSGDTTALNSLSQTTVSVDPSAAASIVEKYQEQFTDLAKLSPESVTVNGKECYQITSELSGEDLYRMAADVMAASGQMPEEASAQSLKDALGGIRMKMSSAIDARTYLPVDGTVDFGESDFSSVQNLLVSSMTGGAADMTADLKVNTLRIDCSFLCDEPVTIAVPQEALDASGAGGAGSTQNSLPADPDDLIGGLLTGGETESGENGGSVSGSAGTVSLSDTAGSSGDAGDSALPEDGAVLNPDGSYRITYTDFQGNVRQADVNVPDGMTLSYGTGDYIVFADEDYSTTVSYSLFTQETPELTVEGDLDVSYLETNADYSDVERTDVLQTSLPDGTPVYYGSKGYVYNTFRLGGTSCALQAGDTIVNIEIERKDKDRNIVEASEEDVLQYAGLVRPAA